MSVLDEIRKLDEQKAKLLGAAKQEALQTISTALKALAELGFGYSLVETSSILAGPAGKRRTGIREEVLAMIQKNPSIGRAQLIEKMNAKGDKSAEQSVSNALSALKKAGTITADNGVYKAK